MLVSRKNLLTIYSDGLYYAEILTDRVQEILLSSNIRTGFVNLLLQHTTSALMLVEHEAGIIMDIKTVLQKLVPEHEEFHHHRRGVDRNGAGHVLSALFNKALTIPVIDGLISLGTYQEILFMDFQPEITERTISVTIFGE